MRQSEHLRWLARFAVCVVVTGAHVGWAEPSRGDLYIEDPYAPHETSGSIARLGTSVGFLYGLPTEILAVGATVAAGHRFNRLTLETEFSFLNLEHYGAVQTALGPGLGNQSLGTGERLGVLARFDVIRLGSHVVGPNSMLAIYVEGGAASAWNHWTHPTMPVDGQYILADTHRIEGQVGFGIALDHRLQEPISFPRRIAWFLGWRLAMTPHQPVAATVCRGISCRAVEMPTDSTMLDRSMLFQSSMAFTF